ncbi:MAG: response regulator [Anaerolineae bacterium]|jgi:DNA-binding response OmpR family regulator|nr:response regulator transcription factor [Ardenticatenia bacterium]MBK8538553.1 response regulator transcription factor [Ardenticatenia bacterium]HQZ71404.1 response regulator transcription factor [Anaerolineae bacterium]HRA19372.1 response regulator transcription factor [Anaerolineae bacterium]
MTAILIVEDDTTLRETLSSTLRAHGYDVYALPDARGLLEKVLEIKPDLLLLDVMLPGLDGLTACRALRTAGNKVPVLMLSARSNDMDKIVGLETGADDYVTKPFSTGELLARVRALLRRAQSEQRSVLDAGDLQMDLIARRAQLRGEELRLTHKEFDLLAELIRNKGMVLSRDLLLEKIWGYDFLGDSRTVDVHIRWLRQKIELEPSIPMRIVTVRGIGYRFDG